MRCSWRSMRSATSPLVRASWSPSMKTSANASTVRRWRAEKNGLPFAVAICRGALPGRARNLTAVPLLHNAAMRARPGLGYALTAVAAALFALNGPLARHLFDDGVSPTHLSEMRSAIAFGLLAGFLAWRAPEKLRIARADVPRMAWLGIAGLALVHAS